MKWIIGIGAGLILVIGATVYFFSTQGNQSSVDSTQNQIRAQVNKENCVAEDCLAVNNLEYPVGKLPVNISKAVKSGLDDEYKAYSTYDAVIKKLGSTRPFSMIIRAEEQHIASLKAILDKYGETIPENPYLGKITASDTLAGNCQIGVQAEIANAALYKNELLPEVTAYPDITTVFTSLMDASNDKHLPAFKKCQ